MNREEGWPRPTGAGIVERLNLVLQPDDLSDQGLEEPLELSIELLEERLTPDHTPYPASSRTAGWGC